MRKTFACALLAFALVQCDSPKENNAKQGAASPLDSLNAMVSYISSNPNDPIGYYNKARYLLDDDKVELALAEIERGIRADSTYSNLHLLRGDLAMKVRDVQNAYLSYGTCARIDSTNLECLMSLAELELALGNVPKTRDLLNTTLRQNMYTGRAYAIRGYMYTVLGDTAIALSSYQTAVEVDPEDYDSFIALGLIHSAQSNDLAVDAFDSALELEPNSTEALYAKAIHLQNTAQGDTLKLQEALTIYRDINQIDPSNSPAFYNQGYIYLEYLEDYENADKLFTKAIEAYPKYHQAFFNRGLAKHSQDKFDAALRDYDKALSIKPDFTEAAQMKESVLRDLGRI